METGETLILSFFMVLVGSWAIILAGSFIAMLLSILWLVLNLPPATYPTDAGLTHWMMKSYDDLGRFVLDQKLARTRRILGISFLTFCISGLVGVAFAILKKVAG